MAVMNPRDARTGTLTVFAPAKINLYLHITGRRPDGYHLLNSLVAFADVGDRLSFAPANDFLFDINGPYAAAFTAADRDAGPNSSNLVVRAVRGLSEAVKRPPQVRVTLTKNLPLASGLGGGSADAAAALWGLLEWWGMNAAAVPGFDGLMRGLGADVPACLSCGPQWVGGTGENLYPGSVAGNAGRAGQSGAAVPDGGCVRRVWREFRRGGGKARGAGRCGQRDCVPRGAGQYADKCRGQTGAGDFGGAGCL